jgi:predicted RNase H-like HicB family nuclease
MLRAKQKSDFFCYLVAPLNDCACMHIPYMFSCIPESRIANPCDSPCSGTHAFLCYAFCMKQQHTFTVYIEQDEDGVFIGSVPALPACHAEGKTQHEMLANLQEVVRLCARNTKKLPCNTFVGIQNVTLQHA